MKTSSSPHSWYFPLKSNTVLLAALALAKSLSHFILFTLLLLLLQTWRKKPHKPYVACRNTHHLSNLQKPPLGFEKSHVQVCKQTSEHTFRHDGVICFSEEAHCLFPDLSSFLLSASEVTVSKTMCNIFTQVIFSDQRAEKHGGKTMQRIELLQQSQITFKILLFNYHLL